MVNSFSGDWRGEGATPLNRTEIQEHKGQNNSNGIVVNNKLVVLELCKKKSISSKWNQASIQSSRQIGLLCCSMHLKHCASFCLNTFDTDPGCFELKAAVGTSIVSSNV